MTIYTNSGHTTPVCRPLGEKTMNTNRIIINRKLRIDRAVRAVKITIIIGGIIGIAMGAVIADRLSNAFNAKDVVVVKLDNPVK